MPENFHPPESKLSKQINDIKTSLFERPVPETYNALIRDARFMLSLQDFSRHLSGAISTESLFSKDEYGRLSTKSVHEIKAILAKSSTEFGNTLKTAAAGKDFIDLASGTPDNSLTRALAEAIRAQGYIGVDSGLSAEQIVTDESGKGENFQAIYIKDDVLSFLAKVKRPENGVLFYISGLEPIILLDPARRAEVEKYNPPAAKADRDVRAYIDACLKELARVTQIGDFVVIGQGTHGFEPQKYGFQLKSQTEHHFLYEKI